MISLIGYRYLEVLHGRTGCYQAPFGRVISHLVFWRAATGEPPQLAAHDRFAGFRPCLPRKTTRATRGRNWFSLHFPETTRRRHAQLAFGVVPAMPHRPAGSGATGVTPARRGRARCFSLRSASRCGPVAPQHPPVRETAGGRVGVFRKERRMARNNALRTGMGSPTAAGGQRVRKREAEEEKRALTRCVYCGKVSTPIHWRCVRCDRIACARCLVAPVTFEWLCPDCHPSGDRLEGDAEVLGGGLPGSRGIC